MPQQPDTLYTDAVNQAPVTITPDQSGWWLLNAHDVFISPAMAAALEQLFATHGPEAHAVQALQDHAEQIGDLG
ncbi:hypothetical protein [Kitasatospora sp. NPDC004289]